MFVDTLLGTWQNSSGLSGPLTGYGVSVITGSGYGGAPGYAGGHSANNGNADFYLGDSDVHFSNIGSRYLGNVLAAGFRTGVLALQ